MKTILVMVFALVATSLQDPHPPAQPTEQHRWLQQLVGDWVVTAEASMGPGTEPTRMESKETVRSIGGLWIQGEGSATIDGRPFTSILTLGYDEAKRVFVGSWIDTMQTHMWIYRGTLDDSKKVLTLAAEGPSFDDPAKTARYQDVIEIVSADHRTLTSSVLGEDGKRTTFMKADYRRQRK